ncbi:MAG: hypothetical protein DCC65_02365 [Planctomycetota bacterium]|nr:MAG: hypothetical protein DCC65_02365 [Planctomycetota bacterium]
MVIDCLSFVMTVAMLYCFARHGIYPAIRFVVRMIAVTVRFVAKKLHRRQNGVREVQRVEVRRLIAPRDELAAASPAGSGQGG